MSDWKRKHGRQKLHTRLLKLAKAFSILSGTGLMNEGRIRETLELARYQDTNEQTHEDIFARDLNGLTNWGDRFLACHITVIIY